MVLLEPVSFTFPLQNKTKKSMGASCQSEGTAKPEIVFLILNPRSKLMPSDDNAHLCFLLFVQKNKYLKYRIMFRNKKY